MSPDLLQYSLNDFRNFQYVHFLWTRGPPNHYQNTSTNIRKCEKSLKIINSSYLRIWKSEKVGSTVYLTFETLKFGNCETSQLSHPDALFCIYFESRAFVFESHRFATQRAHTHPRRNLFPGGFETDPSEQFQNIYVQKVWKTQISQTFWNIWSRTIAKRILLHNFVRLFPNGAETYSDTEDTFTIRTSNIQMDVQLLWNTGICDNIVFLVSTEQLKSESSRHL